MGYPTMVDLIRWAALTGAAATAVSLAPWAATTAWHAVTRHRP